MFSIYFHDYLKDVNYMNYVHCQTYLRSKCSEPAQHSMCPKDLS